MMSSSSDIKGNSIVSGVLSRSGACVWSLLLGLCILPGGARGAVSPDVRRYLVSIHQLIEDLAYERALEQVARGKKVSRGPEDDVAISLYEGILLAELSAERLDDSNAAFKAALFLAPDAQLPLSVSPKLKRRFEAMREEVLGELALRGEDRGPLKTDAPTLQRGPASRGPLPDEAPRRPEPSSSPLSEEIPSLPTTRERAIIPAIAGGALVVTAGVFWKLAEGRKSRLMHRPQELRTEADARTLAQSARGMQTVSVGLLVGGLMGLGVATGMYLLGAPDAPAPVQVGLDGTSVSISGKLP
ncbi:hypothetical protein LZ198_15745 [Myxococcus sp. K15C18031901]|uniref:hypothetical protein n=1 Tax=Myxococcus dinghuensis TaxID=2906761 RepID=UPI0020A76C7B|nr:hypothetical protein [Myxococcus dinghuensis]MCP3100323.1 hypothetical protein [Myxococcus dinghuensis]